MAIFLAVLAVFCLLGMFCGTEAHDKQNFSFGFITLVIAIAFLEGVVF